MSMVDEQVHKETVRVSLVIEVERAPGEDADAFDEWLLKLVSNINGGLSPRDAVKELVIEGNIVVSEATIDEEEGRNAT